MRRGGKRKGPRQHEAERLESRAWRLDAVAVRLARGRPAIDVALGEVFLRLGVDDRLKELGWSRKKDFAHEVLGMPARTFFAIEELARGLRTRPILKAAVMAGEVSPVKARIILLATDEGDDAASTAVAMELTVAGLRKRFTGGVEEAPRYRTVRWSMTAEQQDRLDAAMGLAKELEGYDASEWRLLGRIGRDWLAAHSADAVETEGPSESHGLDDSACKQLEAYFEACELLSSEVGTENAMGLEALAKRLVRRRERFDEPLGRVMERISRDELWRRLGYRSFAEYCRERIGVSESTARQRVRLEKRMGDLPPLRTALKSGLITYTKAVEVARHATRATLEERIAAASETTHQQTKAKADAEEKANGRAKGERKISGPKEALDRFEAAVEACRQEFALQGEPIDAGESRARVGEWFFDRWADEVRRKRWRTKAEQDVLLRHGGLCAVPGCTRAADDSHHIILDSHGGPDDSWNKVAVCRLCRIRHKRHYADFRIMPTRAMSDPARATSSGLMSA